MFQHAYTDFLFLPVATSRNGRQTRHYARGGFIVRGLPHGARIRRHRRQAGLLPGKPDVPRVVHEQPAYPRQVRRFPALLSSRLSSYRVVCIHVLFCVLLSYPTVCPPILLLVRNRCGYDVLYVRPRVLAIVRARCCRVELQCSRGNGWRFPVYGRSEAFRWLSNYLSKVLFIE